MKKLLIVTEQFYPLVGGQQIRYMELGTVFAGNGWSVELLTIGTDPNWPATEKVGEITVHRLFVDATYGRARGGIPRNPWSIVKFAWMVRARLKARFYDVVIFDLFPVLPQILARVPRETVTILDWCEHRSGRIWQGLNRILSRSTDKHIAISGGVNKILVGRYGIHDIQTVPSGIFLNRYRSHAEKKGVLFLGRLSEHKRPGEAIEGVIRARERGFQEGLTVAGGGPLVSSLREHYGHLAFVRILGLVNEDEKLELLATHRLLVLPSIREGFPRVVAEAMASGTPTITTDHRDNGTAAVVREFGCGVVVAPGPEAIAEAICHLTNNPGKWRELSERGLRSSSSLDWPLIYRDLIEYAGVN